MFHTDGWIHMTKLIVAFRNLANARNNTLLAFCYCFHSYCGSQRYTFGRTIRRPISVHVPDCDQIDLVNRIILKYDLRRHMTELVIRDIHQLPAFVALLCVFSQPLLLTPRSRVLAEKLTGPHYSRISLRFITAFTRTRYLYLS